MAKYIFEITINNWAEHNGGAKKHYKYIRLANRFFDDAKISQLRLIETVLFIKCLCIAGDLATDRFEINAGLMPKRWRIDDKSLEDCCKSLQSLQLLSYEKRPLELKRKERKGIELKGTEDEIQKEFLKFPPSDKKSEKNKSAKSDKSDSPMLKFNAANLIGHYCDKWKAAYKSSINPIISGSHAKQLKIFLQNVGEEKAIQIVDAYFRMPDSWFIKKRHDIPTMLANTNSIVHFLSSGKIITNSDVNSIEKTVSQIQNIDEAKKGGF